MTDTVTIAAAAYPLDWHDGFDSYAAKIIGWVAGAVRQGAQILVFPEYAAMELASLGGVDTAKDLQASLREVVRHQAAVEALHVSLAAQYGVYILGGSGPAFAGDRPANRAVLYGPSGVLGHQDKQIMTRFEREVWDVVPGVDGLCVFDTPLGRLGVVICYDSEFPLLSRALSEAGVEILLVPSTTGTEAGFTRCGLARWRGRWRISVLSCTHLWSEHRRGWRASTPVWAVLRFTARLIWAGLRTEYWLKADIMYRDGCWRRYRAGKSHERGPMAPS